MPKKQRAKLARASTVESVVVEDRDERTKPNLRLVKPDQFKPMLVGETPSVPEETFSLKMVPYLFAIVLALGFALLQKDKPSPTKRRAVAEKAERLYQYQNSSLLRVARELGGKK